MRTLASMSRPRRPAAPPAAKRDAAKQPAAKRAVAPAAERPGVVRLAHLSDTHVAFHQYPAKSAKSGRNQREQDVARAFVACLDDINERDPELVIHSGDVADRAYISYRQQRQIQAGFSSITTRKDGSPRMVVVISGNHDMPSDPREPCHLDVALRPLPSVAVVTSRYEVVDLASYVDAGQAAESLRNVVVHAVPHDQLRSMDWDLVQPLPGRINILTSHGVVEGSTLYTRCHGREYAIPGDLLARGWDYVALGHWHKPGPVAVAGFTEATTPIWYAGSPENCGFSDLRDGVDARGYLMVDVASGQLPAVTPVALPIRAMFRLPVIDGAGKSHAELSELLSAAVKKADMSGAVVDQKVLNVDRDVWSLVDVAGIRRAGSDALWFQVSPVFATPADAEGTSSPVGGELSVVLAATIDDLFGTDADRDAILAMTTTLLGDALTATVLDDDDEPDARPAGPDTPTPGNPAGDDQGADQDVATDAITEALAS